LSSQSDNFFIAAFLDPVAVGAYSFYVRLNEMASQLIPTRLFDNVVQPMFFAIPRDKAETRIPRDFSLLLNANLWCTGRSWHLRSRITRRSSL
jgi:O-antigen/teichoic acid export membrane protein